jgi:tRNA synthetases class II (D, K and N)
MRVNDDGRTVAAMDVLAPGIGEITGGSQREERLEVLDRNMAERGIDREHYAWYRDLRRYGAARRLRPRLRAHPRLRHRPRPRPRHHPVSKNTRQRRY